MKIFTLDWWDNGRFTIMSFCMSLILILIIILENSLKRIACGENYDCRSIINLYAYFSFLFFSFLFFSFLFFLQKNKDNFEKWRKFSLWYLLAYLIIVTIFPWYIGDGFLSFQISEAVFFLTGIHFIISLFYLFKKVK